MKRFNAASLLAVAACLAMATTTTAQTLISDSFEADTSADYTRLDESNASSGDGTPDSTADFAFDYISAGVPLAPNSAPGESGALRLAVNETPNDAGAADHITFFHNTGITGPHLFQVDIYMGVETAGGTTEQAHVGVAGTPTDFNSITTPIAGSGHFFAMTGDGGSASDFRHFIPPGTPVNSGDPSYLNSTNTTNATGDLYQTLYADTDFPGSPGNSWTTLSIAVLPDFVTYSLDGTDVVRTETLVTNGSVNLGYADLFSSVGPHFVLFDNLIVTAIPEPASALLLCVMASVALTQGRR